MHPLTNHIMQLQELTLIRDEQKVVSGRSHLEKLDEAILELAGQLPADVRLRFEKLHKKDRIVITPVSEGICAWCGMRLPISLVQAVRAGKEILSCTNCARMLYIPEAPAPRRIARATRRTGPRKVGISRFSSGGLMVPHMDVDDKEEAILELAGRMESEGFVDSAAKLVDAALLRESVLSTSVGNGLAFPHVRGVEGGGLTLALGTSKKGIRFDNDSRTLTRVVVFLVIPTAASAFYLKLLSGLTSTFSSADKRKELLAEKTSEGLWKALVRATRSTVK